MTKNYSIKFLSGIGLCLMMFVLQMSAQVTTSELTGRATDSSGNPVAGVVIEATHVPTGTTYTGVSNDSGHYTIPLMRVGGPYTVKAQQAGFKEQKQENVFLGLGTSGTVNFNLSVSIQEVVTVKGDDTFSETRTGASTNINNEVISTLPTISRTLGSFTRLTPQAGNGGTIGGQDNRLNNITVDGSYFNNSFGLQAVPGERTGVSPIPLDAIEAFQVSVAPYDVGQGNFTGAGINTVTKGGANQYTGSVYYNYQKPGLIGKNAGANAFNPGVFDFNLWGFSVGGPLPFFNFGENNGPLFISGKNKLFFYFSYESEKTTRLAHTFTALTAGQTQGGTVSRVLASDLNALSSYLKTNFGYDTGAYQKYNFAIPAKKFLPRIDWNINSRNRLTLRYINLDSSSDQILSSSGSLGFGRSSPGLTFLSYQGSNYKIQENIRSIVGEWTSSFGSSAANSLTVGYTKQDESRPQSGKLFPFVDILDGSGTAYTSFGFEPFTPDNTLIYNSFQVQDNFTYYNGAHTLQAGVSIEKYHSDNIFFPGAQSAYVYNSLADFYADANGYLANPGRTTSSVTLRRFQVRYSNIPGLSKPIQPLNVFYDGFYGQDQWKLRDNFTLTYGLRADVPFLGKTGYANSLVAGLTFKDETGASVQYKTEQLPNPHVLWSPRVGFNWSPLTSRNLQIRGGSGLFAARPAYVWISNQIGNNGVLTGFDQPADNTTTRPFSPDPNRWKPTTPPSGQPTGSQDLALTDPNYKFPQIWRTSIGADYKIPLGMIAGAEYIYSRDINGTYYINANLSAPSTNFTGPDTRPRWAAGNRINANIVNAIVLKNQNVGRAWNVSFTLEKPFSNGLYFKGGYSYGESKNTVDPGSIASGSWQGTTPRGNPNNPGLGFSSATQGHRYYGAASYHINYFRFGGTTVSTFWETKTPGVGSYRSSGDMNGDGVFNNEALYIPKNQSEMNFETFTSGTTTFTAAQQAAAYDAFIAQDKYLSKHRGEYALRGAAFIPLVTQVDFSLAQDIHTKFMGTSHKFQIRFDVLNFGNLLNKNWGQGWDTSASNNFQPIAYRSTDASGLPLFRLATFRGALINTSYVPRATTSDVYRVQIGFRYVFN